MPKLNFSISINASKEKVWNTLWKDSSYREWTSVFAQGSYAVSDWNEGDKISFLSPTGSGMYSSIARKIPNEFMSFKHIGEVKQGIEQPAGFANGDWGDATENYKLTANGNTTVLEVEMDMDPAYEAYFKDAFPKALDKVKLIAES